MKMTIRKKIVLLVCGVLLLSQILSSVSSFFQVGISREKATNKSFKRTELLVKTLFESEQAKLESQSQMLGSLPVLMAVAGSHDAETIQDTASEYQSRFGVDFFDVVSSEGEVFTDERGDVWGNETLSYLAGQIDESTTASGFAIRAGKLVFFSGAPIGIMPEHIGYLVLGIDVSDAIARNIAEISDSDISFVIGKSVIGSSLSAKENATDRSALIDTISTHLSDQAGSTFSDGDYMYRMSDVRDISDTKVANLVIQASLAETKQLFLEMTLALVAVSLVIVLLFGLVSAKIAATIANPIKKLQRTAEDVVSTLDFKLRAVAVGNDETYSLAQSFNHLLQEIEENHERLADYSKNLEIKVEERTETINTILSNVTSGFCLVDSDMQILEGYTKSCKTIVGEQFDAGQSLAKALQYSAREADHFDACYKEVFEDFMPESVTLGQSPKMATTDDKHIGLLASVVRAKDDSVQSLLFNINDVSELIQAQRENDTNRSLLKILAQKEAFERFIQDTRTLLAEARTLLSETQIDENRLRIILHTIKGNCGAVGLGSQAHLIHEVEDKEVIQLSDIDSIETSFKDYLTAHHAILDCEYESEKEEQYAVSKNSLSELRTKIGEVPDIQAFRRYLETWIAKAQCRPASSLFSTVPDLVSRVADRVMKKVDFKFKGSEVLIDPERFSAISQTLPHIIRNCLDHGIEPPAERGNKSEEGNLEFTVAESGESWSLTIKDDGRGINTDKLVEKSIKSGVLSEDEASAMSKADKLRLIFKDGVSTAEQVSDVSGRGVGMAAVLQAIESSGASLELDSDLGSGTTFRITIPKKQAA